MDDHNHAHGIASTGVQGRNIFCLWTTVLLNHKIHNFCGA